MNIPLGERYRIEGTLGSGSTGVVYRAFDSELERPVALKVLDEGRTGEASHAFIVREARIASALNHPSICTVHEVTEIGGRPCIVMELVEGTSLVEVISPGGLSAELVISYGIQVADALAHAHDSGVIHRDLKSANVMITGGGRAKVLDFGLAQRQRERQREIATEVDVESAGTEEIGGTLPYMSPDVLGGQPPRSADDVWALGVLLYEMATGGLPFIGATRFELATSIQRDAALPLPSTVPPGLREVILRCLSRDPGNRYRLAQEVRAALEALRADARSSGSTRPTMFERWRSPAAALLLLGVILAAYSIWPKDDRAPAVPLLARLAQPPLTIAVLPFANPAGDPQLEYLTDGIAAAVISSLSRLPGKLSVVAWTVVQRYRGTDVDTASAARQLGADVVLHGSISRSGSALSVSAELLRDGTRLWGRSYDVPRSELMRVQQEIASEISANLQLQLTGDEQHALRSHLPAKNEALDLYLKAQHHLNRYTPGDYRRSLAYFQEAIKQDGAYALAYAGLARALGSMTYEGHLPPFTFREVERAAQTALGLDPTVGAAHDALAHVKFAYEWDWAAAEQRFTRALALSPQDEAIHRFYGIFLRTQRRWDEALAQMKIAVDLNSVSADTRKALGATFLWAGQYDMAIATFHDALKLDPAHSQAIDLLADAYAAKGLYAEALHERRRYLEAEGAFAAAQGLGADTSEAGYRSAMRRLYRQYLDRLVEATEDTKSYVSPMEFAFTYVALGDTNRAFDALERAFGDRAPWLSSLAADPAFEPLRSDERYAKLLTRIGLAGSRSAAQK